jgi:hypothetical protein
LIQSRRTERSVTPSAAGEAIAGAESNLKTR